MLNDPETVWNAAESRVNWSEHQIYFGNLIHTGTRSCASKKVATKLKSTHINRSEAEYCFFEFLRIAVDVHSVYIEDFGHSKLLHHVHSLLVRIPVKQQTLL